MNAERNIDLAVNETAGYISMMDVFLALAVLMLVLFLGAAGEAQHFRARSEKDGQLIKDELQRSENLRTELANIKDDKARLEKQLLALLEARKKSAQQITDLTKAKTALEAELHAAQFALKKSDRQIEDLTKAKTALEDDLRAARLVLKKCERQVTDLMKAKTALEAELRAAQLALSKSEQHVTDLTKGKNTRQDDLRAAQLALKKTERLTEDLTKAKTALEDDLRAALVALKGAEEELKRLRQEIEDFRKVNRRYADERGKLQGTIDKLRIDQSTIRKDLIGLQGKLERVVFVIDRSGSMKNRWEHTSSVVETWLTHLLVKECAILTFSTGVDTFGDGTGLLNMSGGEGEKNRKLIRTWLLGLKPVGHTNTLAALQRAYRYDKIDTIILFTDGEPRIERTPAQAPLDFQMRDDIYKLVDRHPGIRMNVIGLGNFYGNRACTEFLLELARRTKGSFIGR